MIDLHDETFVVAPPADVARRLADPRLWARWWPALELTVSEDRGPQGLRWAVRGELSGSAEIWLDPWHDGVIVHWFLRADPATRARVRPVGTRPLPTRPLPSRALVRLRRGYAEAYKGHIHAFKDQVESGRPAGVPRSSPER